MAKILLILNLGRSPPWPFWASKCASGTLLERTFGALCPLLVFITLSCLNLLYFLLILVSFLGDGTPKNLHFYWEGRHF